MEEKGSLNFEGRTLTFESERPMYNGTGWERYLDTSSPDCWRFRMKKGPLFWIFIPMLLIPLAGWALFLLTGGIILLIKMCSKRAFAVPAFDFQNDCFYRDRKKPKYGDFTQLNNYLPLSKVTGLQLLYKEFRGSKGSTTEAYELNLMTDDLKRVYVCDSGNYEKLRAAAELLAEKLNVPVKVHLRQEVKVKKFPAWIGFIFLFGFSGLGGLALYLHVCQPLYRSLQACEFQPVSAVVTKSVTVSERRKSKNSSYTVYKADISFAYMVKGKKYSSNNYTYFDDFSRSSSRANAMVRKHPAGKKITCYINPDKPEQVVVDRTIPYWELALESLGYTFFLVMGFVIFAILRAQRKK